MSHLLKNFDPERYAKCTYPYGPLLKNEKLLVRRKLARKQYQKQYNGIQQNLEMKRGSGIVDGSRYQPALGGRSISGGRRPKKGRRGAGPYILPGQTKQLGGPATRTLQRPKLPPSHAARPVALKHFGGLGNLPGREMLPAVTSFTGLPVSGYLVPKVSPEVSRAVHQELKNAWKDRIEWRRQLALYLALPPNQ